MSNKKLAESFANGSTKGKGSNLFIEGDTIFSYSHHFPVARRLPGGGYWFNPEEYSKSTSRHQSFVRQFCG